MVCACAYGNGCGYDCGSVYGCGCGLIARVNQFQGFKVSNLLFFRSTLLMKLYKRNILLSVADIF